MGLAVEVGVLSYLKAHDEEGAEWFRSSMSQTNEVLAEKGIEPFAEPEDLSGLKSRAQCVGFSYSYLHYLRRFYAHITTFPEKTPEPVAEGTDPAQDSDLQEEYYMLSSHLICHSDCEGYYLPLELKEIVFDLTDKNRILGGMLGSSFALQRELIEMAPYLNITLDNNSSLSDAEAEKINEAANSDDPFHIEKLVWICLFEAARLSIEHQTAITFC